MHTYFKLGGDVVLLVGGGKEGGAGGGLGPRHRVRVMRRQPRVPVERKPLILHPPPNSNPEN